MGNKLVPTWLKRTLIMICAVSFGFQLWYCISFSPSPLMIAANVIGAFSIIFALFYFIDGYQKQSAIFFKIFSVIFLLNSLTGLALIIVDLLNASFKVVNIISLVFCAINCLSVFVLTFIKNLGKSKSFTLSVVANLSVVITAACFLFVEPKDSVCFLGTIVVSLIYCVMVYAKYKDKTARGTK